MRALPVAVALALSFNAVSAHAQAAPHRWIEATASAGASFTGPGSRYQESAQGALTLGAGVGVTHRVGVEVSAALNVGWGYPILSCDLSPSPCPVRFHVRSLSGDVVLNVGPQTHPSRLRLLVGAGSYRLASTEPSPTIASTICAISACECAFEYSESVSSTDRKASMTFGLLAVPAAGLAARLMNSN